ncbi:MULTISPECIES: hypothetical protein [unclassified Mesorhizobium]|uniref:hypothetical protein n=1 Tax=unclassified Mesorhizobium TaxID=325217 RepID=UPI003337AB7B
MLDQFKGESGTTAQAIDDFLLDLMTLVVVVENTRKRLYNLAGAREIDQDQACSRLIRAPTLAKKGADLIIDKIERSKADLWVIAARFLMRHPASGSTTTRAAEQASSAPPVATSQPTLRVDRWREADAMCTKCSFGIAERLRVQSVPGHP